MRRGTRIRVAGDRGVWRVIRALRDGSVLCQNRNFVQLVSHWRVERV